MSAIKIGIIGLGYVGLPLAHLMASKYIVIGFDRNKTRIKELKLGKDKTKTISKKYLLEVMGIDPNKEKGLIFTFEGKDLATCNYYIITVPTPIDKHNRPDLQLLYQASVTVGKALKKGDIVIYESTVYPGATEEECVPILERISGLAFNIDFFVGYSPERINPGDRKHTIANIRKITSGSTPEIGKKIDLLYNSVITAGTYLAPSIKIAEAAKVIENSQRDINIAFVNELAKIFNLMGIDTNAVLDAAGTKWNFLPFKPGLVGGHCIGVDPYYLAQKAQEFGYNPEIILMGRRMNDGMGRYVASEVIKLMVQKGIEVKRATILILGITFKENCPDVRNSRAVDVVTDLQSYGAHVSVYDPWASPTEVKDIYKIDLALELPQTLFDVVVLLVAHNEFLKFTWRKKLKKSGVIYDVKGFLKEPVDTRL